MRGAAEIDLAEEAAKAAQQLSSANGALASKAGRARSRSRSGSRPHSVPEMQQTQQMPSLISCVPGSTSTRLKESFGTKNPLGLPTTSLGGTAITPSGVRNPSDSMQAVGKGSVGVAPGGPSGGPSQYPIHQSFGQNIRSLEAPPMSTGGGRDPSNPAAYVELNQGLRQFGAGGWAPKVDPGSTPQVIGRPGAPTTAGAGGSVSSPSLGGSVSSPSLGGGSVAHQRFLAARRANAAIRCKEWSAGRCQKGSRCPFSHENIKAEKTELCNNFLTHGVCVAGNYCKRAHSEDELAKKSS